MKKTKKTIILFALGLIVLPNIVFADNRAEVVGETTKYYKTTTTYPSLGVQTYSLNPAVRSETVEVSEEEYNNSDQMAMTNSYGPATVETTYKKMSTTISAISSHYRYENTLLWKNIPSTRSYDTIAIGFPASVKASGTADFTNRYCTSATNCTTVTGYAYRYSDTNGVAATFKLPTGTLTSLRQTLGIDIEKNTTATIIRQNAVGDYAHAVSSISLTKAKKYEVGVCGIEFEQAAINYYDEIMEADLVISCNW